MRRFAAVLAVCVCLVAGVGLPAASATPEAVIPPSAHPYGLSYAQWSVAWWQWAYRTPVNAKGRAGEQNPLSVGSGPIDCRYRQSGPVWFLAGTFEQTPGTGGTGPVQLEANRSCTKPVPRGITLMVPVINGEFDNVLCPGTPPPAGWPFTAAQLRAQAIAAIDGASDMFVTIDGRPVDDISGPDTPYRVATRLFQYTLPQDNLYNITCGETFPAGRVPPPGAVGDGVYVMLRSLAPGVHVVHWGGAAGGATGFTQDITYTFRVARD